MIRGVHDPPHIRELKQRRRRRQQERQKSNWFRLANNSFVRVSRFFVHFFAVTALLRRENAYFHVLWRTWTQDHDFLFLLLNFDTIFKNWSPDKNYQHLTNWTRWNKRDKVKSSATSLLEWRFRSRRRRIMGTLRPDEGDGRENVAEKVISRFFNLHCDYSKLITLSNVGELS